MDRTHLFVNPILIINMGAEMLYVLDQRLQAQNIPKDKGGKVLSDLCTFMFAKKFIEKIFRPEKVYSLADLKEIFHKIVMCSIMHLNETSFSKLFDLMFMGLKRQILCLRFPQELVLFTLQHFDGVFRLISDESAIDCLSAAKERFLTTYMNLSAAELLYMKRIILTVSQSRNVRVSLFLESGIQTQDGNIVVSVQREGGFMVTKPGTLIWASKKRETLQIPIFSHFIEEYEKKWDNYATKLGNNLYTSSPSAEKKQEVSSLPTSQQPSLSQSTQKNNTKTIALDHASAKKEINELSSMIKGSSSNNQKEDISISVLSQKNKLSASQLSAPFSLDKGFEDMLILEVGTTKTTTKLRENLNSMFDDIPTNKNQGMKNKENEEENLLDLMDSATQMNKSRGI